MEKCSGDIELCGSTIAIVLQSVKDKKDNFDGVQIFKNFVKENSLCFWKPELINSVTSLR